MYARDVRQHGSLILGPSEGTGPACPFGRAGRHSDSLALVVRLGGRERRPRVGGAVARSTQCDASLRPHSLRTRDPGSSFVKERLILVGASLLTITAFATQVA